MKSAKINREILKSGDWSNFANMKTDQASKIPMPKLQKGYHEESVKIDLMSPKDFTIGKLPIIDVISKRKSRRKYTNDFLTIEEISYLLWATQGVKSESKSQRTVPSAGARHPFETYLYIQKIENINPGLYRYLPLEHNLLFLAADDNLSEKIQVACNQEMAGNGAVTFIWTTIPYRTEWRYDILSHKLIALDAGHVCQNLYLASESINCGTCAIGAYNQKEIDTVIGVDGIDEFVIYVAPVGRIEKD